MRFCLTGVQHDKVAARAPGPISSSVAGTIPANGPTRSQTRRRLGQIGAGQSRHHAGQSASYGQSALSRPLFGAPSLPTNPMDDNMYGEADSVTSQATASAMESIVKHDHLPRISQPRIHAGQTRPPPPRLASGRKAAAIRAKAADFAVQCRPCVAVEAPSRRAVSSAYQACSRRGGSVPALLVHFSYVANAKGMIAILPMTGQTEGLALRCCCAS